MEQDVGRRPDGAPGLFRGAPAYAIETKWGPWLGLLAVVLIMGLSAGFAYALVRTGVVAVKTQPGDSMGLGILAAGQAATVVLTLIAAAWGGWRGTLAWRSPPGGLRTYVEALGLLLALQAVGTLAEFGFVREQMLRDLLPFAEIARGPSFLFGLLVVAIGAPLSEELVFRGLLFSALANSRLRLVGASLITTAIWTVLHAGYAVAGLVEVFLIGLYFSWVLWRTGSLRVTLVCHGVYNGLIMLVLHFVPLPVSA